MQPTIYREFSKFEPKAYIYRNKIESKSVQKPFKTIKILKQFDGREMIKIISDSKKDLFIMFDLVLCLSNNNKPKTFVSRRYEAVSSEEVNLLNSKNFDNYLWMSDAVNFCYDGYYDESK